MKYVTQIFSWIKEKTFRGPPADFLNKIISVE